MKRNSLGITGLIVVTLLFAFNSWAEQTWKNTITASGKGEVHRPPDVAYITLHVQEEGMLAVDAIKNMDEKIKKVIGAIKEEHKEIQMEIEVKTLKLGNKTDNAWGQEKKKPSPEATKELLITLHNLDSKIISTIIDTALRSGAVFPKKRFSSEEASAVDYGLLNYEEAYEEALKEAIQEAKQEAEKVAKLLGRRVGEIVYVGGTEK